MKRAAAMIALGLGALLPALSAADQALLHMEIGDPARRSREVPVTLDAITASATGELIAPTDMARRLAGTRILFIGENHANMDFHDVQLRTIQALHEAGREVLIGVEMFPYTEQPSLDAWTAKRYSETQFVDRANWYEHWSYHWNYYRDTFLYARDRGLKMYAVNSPRFVVKTVRQKGFQDLTAEEAAHLPPALAAESGEHRRLYRAFFDADDALHMNAEALDGLYRAQTTWDATMGWNALQTLRQHGGPNAIMVVLIGAGHVAYGLGSERQIAPFFEGGISSLMPVPIVDDAGQPVSQVRASYASFLWGIPAEKATAYPSLGISLMGPMGSDPGQIIQVSRGSVGERAGLQVNDVLLTIDGVPINSRAALSAQMSRYRWGDVATARIRRDGRETDRQILIRRAPPAS